MDMKYSYKGSIIVPVFNSQRYIENTLHSLFKQTYKNIEIICINDGSTDDSLAILEKYQDKIVIINQTNKGQCAASNNGLKHATGDYIKFFDADDLMNPEHIELQVKCLNGRTDAIASCEWGRFYDNNPNSAVFNPEAVWKDLLPLEWLKTSLSQKADMMGAWLWLIPRQVLEKSGGWDERLSLNNDFEFSTRLLLAAKEVLFTPGAKLYYRSGLTDNLANTSGKLSYEAALLSTQLGCQYLLEAENSEQMRLLCANRYQEWAYRIYPQYPDILKKIEMEIKRLGGSAKNMDGGKVFKLLSSIMGWKLAKRFQALTYKVGYQPQSQKVKN
jgi:glycosyltransferase involved in cell wall biosynthesis